MVVHCPMCGATADLRPAAVAAYHKLEVDCRSLLLSFLHALTLCDHMGDVSNDMLKVFKELGMELPSSVLGEDDMIPLRRWLESQGVTDLYA